MNGGRPPVHRSLFTRTGADASALEPPPDPDAEPGGPQCYPEAVKADPPEKGGASRCLLVQSGEYRCALPLHQVRRVLRAIPVSPLPQGSHELLGLAEHGGEPLPVFDLARLVEAPPGPNPEAPVTVVAWGGRGEDRELIGLNADAALRLCDIDPTAMVSVDRGLVRGEVLIDGEPVRVLDLEALGTPG